MSFLPVNVTDLPQCTDWNSMGSGIRDIMIGFGLVVFASAGICGALNLQKLVHVRNADPVTGEPHVHFARLPLWWAGILLNTVSELVRPLASSTGSCALRERKLSLTRLPYLATYAGKSRGAWIRAGHAGHSARLHHRRLQLW